VHFTKPSFSYSY